MAERNRAFLSGRVSRARLAIFVAKRDQELTHRFNFGMIDLRKWLRLHGIFGRSRRLGIGLPEEPLLEVKHEHRPCDHA